MTHGVTLHPVTGVDIAMVAANMHPGHVAEVWAIGRQTPLAALERSVALTDEPVAARADGVPVAVLGVSFPVLDECGTPWMLGTMEVEKHPRVLLTIGRAMVRDAHERGVVALETLVWAGYPQAGRLLQHLGFTLGPVFTGEYGARVRSARRALGDPYRARG